MSTLPPLVQERVVYPESDGLPMSDNTEQFAWISRIKWGIDHVFVNDPNVFVAGDLLWYPVENQSKIRAAPDTMVVLGRPKGHRGSYRQWEEDDIPPQVVFEILSPGNTAAAMIEKRKFYDRYGVEEYYIYDPHGNAFEGWLRRGFGLTPIDTSKPWVSPLLKLRFEVTDDSIEIFAPNGEAFVGIDEVFVARDRAVEEVREKEVVIEQTKEESRKKDAVIEQTKEESRKKDAVIEQTIEESRKKDAVIKQKELVIEQQRMERERLFESLRQLGIDPDELAKPKS
ncbi:MAG: Uma2 family endonuclease [Planctomycetota bacterium]|nr:Uma2 family endonuclease [Planctomycetota bacterium]